MASPQRDAEATPVEEEITREAKVSTSTQQTSDAEAALVNGQKNHDGAIILYDKWAASYDQDVRNWGYEAPEQVADRVVSWMSSRGKVAAGLDMHFLDAGCGTGMAGAALQKAFGESELGNSTLKLTGTDCSKDSLEYCRKKTVLTMKKKGESEEGIEHPVYTRLEYANLDLPQVENFPEENVFDGIMCVGVLSYVGDFKVLFSEWCRICKKGAVIVFTHRTPYWDEGEKDSDGYPLGRKGEQKVARELETQGKWKQIEKSGLMPYLPKHSDYPPEVGINYLVYEVL